MKKRRNKVKKSQLSKGHVGSQLIRILFTFVFMILGLYLLKWYPTARYGNAILFDASAHIVFASFILYIFYCFIDQNEKWKIPFFILSCFVLLVISFQRIYISAHNDIGILLGLIIAGISIAIPQWNDLKNKIQF